MVEGRLVGPQFTEGFGWVEDGGADKTDLEHKVLLKCEVERGQRGGVRSPNFSMCLEQKFKSFWDRLIKKHSIFFFCFFFFTTTTIITHFYKFEGKVSNEAQEKQYKRRARVKFMLFLSLG